MLLGLANSISQERLEDGLMLAISGGMIQLTIIPRARVGYKMRASLAIIISFPTSESGKIISLKTTTKNC